MNDLFDVSSLLSYGCYQGLFFDRQLQLWTNQNGRFRRLANQWSLPAGDYPMSLTELREKVAHSHVFREFVKKVRAALNEYHEKSLKGKFVIAIIDDEGSLVFGDNPKIYATREEADLRLMRYQQINPETRFCLFKCEGELKSVGVVLE
jgi:hypothetical protein